MSIAVLRVVICVLGVIGGWYLATPLQAIANRLLASVPVEDAAPSALALVAGNVAEPAATIATLPLVLTPIWRGTLRFGLAGGVPLALWHATAFWHSVTFGESITLVALVVCVAALVLIAVLDGAAHLVFAEVLVPPIASVLLVAFGVGQHVWLPLLLGGVVGGTIFLACYLFGRLRYGTDALGFGDVQLAAAFGIMLGWPLLIDGLLLGMIALVIVTLPLLALRRITTTTYLPIGSFLALGTLAVLLIAPTPWSLT